MRTSHNISLSLLLIKNHFSFVGWLKAESIHYNYSRNNCLPQSNDVLFFLPSFFLIINYEFIVQVVHNAIRVPYWVNIITVLLLKMLFILGLIHCSIHYMKFYLQVRSFISKLLVYKCVLIIILCYNTNYDLVMASNSVLHCGTYNLWTGIFVSDLCFH